MLTSSALSEPSSLSFTLAPGCLAAAMGDSYSLWNAACEPWSEKHDK